MLGHFIQFLHQLALDALGLMLAVFCGALQPTPATTPSDSEAERARSELSASAADEVQEVSSRAPCLSQRIALV